MKKKKRIQITKDLDTSSRNSSENHSSVVWRAVFKYLMCILSCGRGVRFSPSHERLWTICPISVIKLRGYREEQGGLYPPG